MVAGQREQRRRKHRQHRWAVVAKQREQLVPIERLGHNHASAYEALKAEFTQEEQVKLTLMINVINGWNRLAVGFGLWVEPAAAKTIAEKAVA